jgi:hypothetical protein
VNESSCAYFPIFWIIPLWSYWRGHKEVRALAELSDGDDDDDDDNLLIYHHHYHPARVRP